jgi:hypothetical protein
MTTTSDTIHFECQFCSKKLKAGSDQAHRHGRCKNCDALFVIPSRSTRERRPAPPIGMLTFDEVNRFGLAMVFAAAIGLISFPALAATPRQQKMCEKHGYTIVNDEVKPMSIASFRPQYGVFPWRQREGKERWEAGPYAVTLTQVEGLKEHRYLVTFGEIALGHTGDLILSAEHAEGHYENSRLYWPKPVASIERGLARKKAKSKRK